MYLREPEVVERDDLVLGVDVDGVDGGAVVVVVVVRRVSLSLKICHLNGDNGRLSTGKKGYWLTQYRQVLLLPTFCSTNIFFQP